MSERPYTVAEIDALREVCRHKYVWGTYWDAPLETGRGRSSRNYREQDCIKAAEEMVRTHMLAGHTALDLIAHDQASWAEFRQQRERVR